MLLPLGAALALHASLQVGEPAKRPPSLVRDSSVADSTARSDRRRLPVTAAVLATAFRDERAKDLFYRARTARLAMDSSLVSYDAKVRERVSLGMGIGERGRERVVYRHENASRVRWQEGVGARIDLTGARMAIPINPSEAKNELQGDLARGEHSAIPYFPGYEPLAPTNANISAPSDVNDRSMVHPLAVGAEAYYTYESGDSVRYALPGGSVVQLREVRFRPRSPKWNLAVGLLMFDIASGQLVRAAYRLSAPADFFVVLAEQADTTRDDSPPAILRVLGKTVLSPFTAQISEMSVEYSLHSGRFWLPRSRTMKGTQQMAFARLSFTMDQAFSYTSVNGGETLPPLAALNQPYVPPGPIRAPDSLSRPAARKWRDSVRTARDTIRKAFKDSLYKAPCDSTGNRTVTGYRTYARLPVTLSFPCDFDKLANSPDFSKSLFDADEEVFGSADRDELIARALALGAQAPLLQLLPAPRFQYGLSMTRYNRVEGFSTGLLVEQQLGGGYVASMTGRLGAADLEPNGELSLARSNLSKTITLTGYNRLVSTGDWGRPLSFGSGVSAFLFGRDEGFYYRASGAELGFQSVRGLKLDWRLFAEQQRTARQETAYSVGGRFAPNIVAAQGLSAGAAVRFAHSYGLDPRGFRAYTDVRLEGAGGGGGGGGDSTYGRGAIDVTLSRGIPGSLTAALTLAGGSTVGGVPPQRLWYLGGTHTVRGQRPDTAQSGNAFWMGRAEIGRDFPIVRAALFGDLGWVGDRRRISGVGRPLSGVGVGLSLMDGLLRFDVARGVYPSKKVRVDLYLGGRF